MDFYLAKYISLGFDVDSQFLFLSRPKPALPCPAVGGVQPTQAMCQAAFDMSAPPQAKLLYDNSGSSVGFGFGALAHLGVHF
jgi:hypothetical protein